MVLHQKKKFVNFIHMKSIFEITLKQTLRKLYLIYIIDKNKFEQKL